MYGQDGYGLCFGESPGLTGNGRPSDVEAKTTIGGETSFVYTGGSESTTGDRTRSFLEQQLYICESDPDVYELPGVQDGIQELVRTVDFERKRSNSFTETLDSMYATFRFVQRKKPSPRAIESVVDTLDADPDSHEPGADPMLSGVRQGFNEVLSVVDEEGESGEPDITGFGAD